MDNAHLLYLLIFICGYGLIIFEHAIKINKAAISLLTGVLMWMAYFYADGHDFHFKVDQLKEHVTDIAQILFFLIGAMTIVELMAVHKGFDYMKDLIKVKTARSLFWVLLLVSFWFSSVLDNLTTILLMVTLVKQMTKDHNLIKYILAGLVFAVNAGGAWTPIGDVTTTMLWIEGRVNTGPIIQSLFLPSFSSLILFGLLYAPRIGNQELVIPKFKDDKYPGAKRVLIIGLVGLLMVPVLKVILHIPPFVGMLLVLGVLWVVTDRIHQVEYNRHYLRVEHVLTKIDISCIMFFLGILLAVDCLESTQILKWMSGEAQQHIPNPYIFTMAIGVLSAIVDNVPLVAGMIRMFDPSVYPADHIFWSLTAYCAGVGGSLLIIGSAPGVAIMSLADVSFGWYLRTVSWATAVAYVFGWAFIFIQDYLTSNM
jgi:Na+/H+ antiporter NhaD/arsenite permease-like protein